MYFLSIYEIKGSFNDECPAKQISFTVRKCLLLELQLKQIRAMDSLFYSIKFFTQMIVFPCIQIWTRNESSIGGETT